VRTICIFCIHIHIVKSVADCRRSPKSVALFLMAFYHSQLVSFVLEHFPSFHITPIITSIVQYKVLSY